MCIAAGLSGCGPAVSDKELGQVVFGVPDVTNKGEVYKLPPAPGNVSEPEPDESEPQPH